MNQQIKQAVRRLYKDGVSVKELCLLCNRSQSVMYRWISPDNERKHKESHKKWQQNNWDKVHANIKRYRATAKGKAADKRYGNSEKGRTKNKNWKHSDKGLAYGRQVQHIRRLLKTNTEELVFVDGCWQEVDQQLTFELWGDYLLPKEEREAINDLCLQAVKLSEATGIEHHVDHIQPLSKGGLHAMVNLQIITAEENLAKGDTFRICDQELLCKRLFGYD